MADNLPAPESRVESYLAKAAGEDVAIPEKPLSRTEQYLAAIAEGGGGGGGGTSNFNELNNRPSYNGVTMTGSTNIPEVKSYTAGENITINGTTISATDTKYTAGTNVSISEQNVISATDTTYTAGTGLDLTGTEFSVDTDTIQEKLVAGTNITINGNTISAAGGGSSYTAGDGIDISAQDVISATNTGKARVLTTDDYNYPTDNPDSIALWLLEPGLYQFDGDLRYRYVSSSRLTGHSDVFLIGKTTSNTHIIPAYQMYYQPDTGKTRSSLMSLHDDGSSYSINYQAYLINNLTSTSDTLPLAASQGKALKDLIDSIAIRGAGAPTTSTVGEVGQLYEDGTNGALYQLKSIDITTTPNTYNWEQVGGSSVNVVQTTGTSTTDVMSQNAVTSMVFADNSTDTIEIGMNARNGNNATSVAIGWSSRISSNAYNSIAIGKDSTATAQYSIALGGATANVQGVMAIGMSAASATQGYNSSAYRLLTGLYDPQNAHDAANKEYVDATIAGTDESLTIATSDWAALASSAPYTYSATVTLTATISATSTLALENDQPVLFANYGFVIGSADTTTNTVTIYSIGQPDASVTLNLNIK